MKTTKSYAALPAAAVLALAGCLDSNPIEPSRPCILNESPVVSVAGDTIRAANGLKTIELVVGDGATVEASSNVVVCYVGFFPNGQVFDLGSGFGFIPAENRTIEGFSQGVLGMKEGGARRIVIPPALGYGSEPWPRTGTVVIPANSTIVFDVGVRRIR